LRGRGTLVGEKSPANSPSHEVFDDTSRASVVELHARHASACEDRARVDPAGPRSRDPRPAPPSMRRCLPRAGRAPLPLTPCRRRTGTEVPIHRWTRPTPRARQGPRIERARAPSIDECPLDPRLRVNLERGPATGAQGFATLARLPTLLRCLEPLFWRGEELDHRLPRRSSRRGALDHASFVDFCHRIDPRARPADLRYPPWCRTSGLRLPSELPVGPRISLRPSPREQGSSETAESSFLGSGALDETELALGPRRPPAAMARGGGFAPTQWTRTPLVARSTLGRAGEAKSMNVVRP